MKQHGRSVVLAYRDIDAPVAVVVGDRRSPLIATEAHTRLRGILGNQFARTVSKQQQTSPGVEALGSERVGKEVLSEKQILVAVPVEVGDRGMESRCALGGRG